MLKGPRGHRGLRVIGSAFSGMPRKISHLSFHFAFHFMDLKPWQNDWTFVQCKMSSRFATLSNLVQSCSVHALLKFCDDILENMDNSKVTGACYLDLKKAFDTVEHSILLKKLAAHGVDEKSVGWFTSYLSNRSQRTSVGNLTSTPSYVSIGVLRGSVLGPLLFLIYI